MSVTLDTGDIVVLSNVSGSTISGVYTVGAGDNSLDLTISAINSASILDVFANTNTVYSIPVAPGNIASTSNIIIDTTNPSLVSFTSTTPDETYGLGDNINITANFNEDLDAGSTMSITLDTGDVIILSNVSGSTLSGTYIVSREDSSLDLTITSIVSVNVSDVALNTATTYLLPVAPNNIADTSQIVIVVKIPSGGGGNKPKNNTPVTPVVPVTPTTPSTNPAPQNSNNFELNPVACEDYIKSYIQLGANNNIEDVKRLETFLNTYEGMKLPVDGVFSKADEDAVKVFQGRHADVLSFWNLSKPTGYVYITTQKAINRIYCEKINNMTCPYFVGYAKQGDKNAGVTKIKAFLNNTQNEKLPLTDNFDIETKQAVIRFQSKFKDRVLTPWKLTQPTGHWYQSTRKKAHDIIGCFAPQRLDNGVILD
jgi:hypothetical protein